MTTIAFRDGCLAVDSSSTHQATHVANVDKLARGPDGTIAAACGEMLACGRFLQWIEGGEDGVPGIDRGKVSAIVVRPDGRVFMSGTCGTMVRMRGRFFADGSGFELALAAMEAGADAEAAVRIACKYDGASGLPVRSIRL